MSKNIYRKIILVDQSNDSYYDLSNFQLKLIKLFFKIISKRPYMIYSGNNPFKIYSKKIFKKK